MTGMGIARGMWLTFRHFWGTYAADLRRFPRRYRDDAKSVQQTADEAGVFTVQYPEEQLRIFERFRSFPVLIYDAVTLEDRCTACGICAKACPPQCIWIVRDKDATGRPRPQPAQFYIDLSICMSCGFCAEFCPFDAIKMDHKFEMATGDRSNNVLVMDKKQLSVSTEYYAQTHPVAWSDEEEAKRKKAAAKGR